MSRPFTFIANVALAVAIFISTAVVFAQSYQAVELALVIVSSQPQVEADLLDRLMQIRRKAGLVDTLCIFTMHLENEAEAAFCRQYLDLDESQLPCIALIRITKGTSVPSPEPAIWCLRGIKPMPGSIQEATQTAFERWATLTGNEWATTIASSKPTAAASPATLPVEPTPSPVDGASGPEPETAGPTMPADLTIEGHPRVIGYSVRLSALDPEGRQWYLRRAPVAVVYKKKPGLFVCKIVRDYVVYDGNARLYIEGLEGLSSLYAVALLLESGRPSNLVELQLDQSTRKYLKVMKPPFSIVYKNKSGQILCEIVNKCSVSGNSVHCSLIQVPSEVLFTCGKNWSIPDH